MFGLWARARTVGIVEPDAAKRQALRHELADLAITYVEESEAASRAGDGERARVFRGLAVVAHEYTKDITP